MPGVPTPDLEGRQEPSAGPEEPALQGARQEAAACRQVLEQRVAEAKRVVSMLVSAIGNLRQEAATLRAEQQQLRQHMEKLRKFLNQEKEPSTCAQPAGTEAAEEPVSHRPTSASVGESSERHLSSGGPEGPPAAGSSE